MLSDLPLTTVLKNGTTVSEVGAINESFIIDSTNISDPTIYSLKLVIAFLRTILQFPSTCRS